MFETRSFSPQTSVHLDIWTQQSHSGVGQNWTETTKTVFWKQSCNCNCNFNMSTVYIHKLTSGNLHWNESKVQYYNIIINTQVKYRYLKNLLEYSNKVFVFVTSHLCLSASKGTRTLACRTSSPLFHSFPLSISYHLFLSCTKPDEGHLTNVPIAMQKSNILAAPWPLTS